MENDFSIILSAKLDEILSTKNINGQLKELAKKIDSLKLNVEIDKDALKSIESIVNNSKVLRDLYKQNNETIKTNTQIIKELDGTTRKITQELKASGEIHEKTTHIIDKKVQKTKEETSEIVKQSKYRKEAISYLTQFKTLQSKEVSLDANRQVSGISRRFKAKDGSSVRVKYDSEDNVLGAKIVQNLEEEAKATQKLKDSKEDLRKKLVELARAGSLVKNEIADVARLLNKSDSPQSLQKANEEYQRLFLIQKAIKQNEKDNFKLDEAERKKTEAIARQNAELEHQIKLYQKRSEIKVDKLLAGYSKSVNSDSLNNYIATVEKLSTETPHSKRAMSELKVEFDRIAISAKKAAGTGIDFGDAFGQAMTKFPIWMATSTLFYGTLRAAQDIFRTIVEIDTQVTHLKRVMDENTNFDEMLSSAISLSSDLGQSITEINKAMIGFAQQGFSPIQTIELTKTAVVASNVSDLSTEDSMNDITSAMIQFNIEASKSISIIDKINEVDNNFAITTKDIAQAVHKSGAAAKTYGVSIDELVGQVTAIGAATRESGNIVGNSLKTIYSRLPSKPSVEALKSVGVEIFKLDGTTRSATEVINDLAKKWNNLSNTEQQHLGVTIAGRYQLTRFLALMNNHQMAIDATKTSLHSQGSAMRENEKYMESMQAHINQLTSAWDTFAIKVGQSGLADLFMMVVDGLTSLANGMAHMTEATHGFNLIIPVLAGSVWGVIKAYEAWKVASVALRVESTLLQASMGWIGLISAGVGLVASAIVGASKDLNDSSQNIIDAAKQHEQTASRIRELVNQYEQLSPQAKENADKQEELKQVMLELQRLAPHLVQSIDAQGKSFELSADKAREYADALEYMSNEQKNRAIEVLNAQLVTADAELTRAKESLDDYKSEYENSQKIVNDLLKKYGVQRMSMLQDEIEKQKESGRISGFDAETDIRVLDIHSGRITDKNYSEQIGNIQDLENKQKSYTEKLQILNGQVIENANSNIELSESNDDVADSVDNVEKNTDIYKGVLSDLYEEYNKASTSVKDLNSLLNDLANGKKISADEALNLISKEHDLASAFSIENGMVSVNAEAIEALRKTKIDAFLAMDQTGNVEFQNEQTRLISRLNLYGVWIQGIQSVADAKRALDGLDTAQKFAASDAGYMFDTIDMGIVDTKNQVRSVMEYYEQLEKLKNLASTGLKQSGVNINAPEKKDKEIDPYVSDEFTKKMSVIDLSLEQSQYRMKSYNDTSKEYRAEQLKQIGLFEQKQKLAHQEKIRLDTENEKLKKLISTTKEVEKLNELKKQLDDNISKTNELSKSWLGYGESIRQITGDIDELTKKQEEVAKESYDSWMESQEKLADDLIDTAKEAIDKRKEMELDAIDERAKKEDERHEKEVKNLDDEMRKFDEKINAQLKEINRTDDEDDYQRELDKAQKERNQTQVELDKYALDTSVEGKAKAKELTEKLAEQDEKIEDMKRKRNKDLRNENLEDQKDAYKKDSDNKKKSEENKYQTVKDNLEKEKEEVSQHYDDILNNERYWAEMRKQIISGNFEEIKTVLGEYLKYFDEQVSVSAGKVSKIIKQNITDKLKEGLGMAEGGFDGSDSTIFEKYLTNSLKWHFSDSDTQKQLNNENKGIRQQNGFAEYSFDQIKTQFPEVFAKFQEQAMGDYITNKLKWVRSTDDKERNSLKSENEKYRNMFGFADYTLQDILAMFPELAKAQGFDTGGYTGTWGGGGGKIGIMHQKELMLKEGDTSNILESVGIVRNIVGMLANPSRLLDAIRPTRQGDSDNRPIEINMTNYFTGDKKGGEQLFSTIKTKLGQLGVVTR